MERVLGVDVAPADGRGAGPVGRVLPGTARWTCRHPRKYSRWPRCRVIPVPQPDEDVGDALWSLPEILRVNAELLLWHGGPDAMPAAEAQLLRSLDLARRQSTLSWELRSATSLARLWHRGGRVAEARDLLAATIDRFTEGFGTSDVVTARRLIAEWS